MSEDEPRADPPAAEADDVHTRIGQLTRQLHTALTELGYASQLRGTMVDPAHTADVVADQSQVDDLLASLGF